MFLVLTDQEELDLVRKFTSNNLSEIFQYDTNKKIRRKYENLIFEYLKDSYLNNKNDLEKKFINRDCVGKEAQNLFPLYVDAYGRATKKASINFNNDIYHITLLNEQIFPWVKLKPIGEIKILATSIVKLKGSVTNFSLETNTCNLCFNRKLISLYLPNKV